MGESQSGDAQQSRATELTSMLSGSTTNSPCPLQCPDKTSCPHCPNLKQIDQETDQAAGTPNAAIQRRFILLCDSQLNAAVDPASRLPTEVMRHIFKESITGTGFVGGIELPFKNTDYDDPRYSLYTHRREPLRFGAVSRQWRSIAWGYADLWTTLICPIFGPGHCPHLVSEWLERTGNRRLSIQLYEAKPASGDGDLDPPHQLLLSRQAQEIATIIAAYSSHCESIRLHTSSTKIIDTILRSAGPTSNSLTLTRLSLGGSMPYDGGPLKEVTLLNAEMRHSPTHMCMLSFIPPTTINANWTRITHFYAERMSRRALQTLLSYISSSLTDLRVGRLAEDRWYGEDDAILPSATPITLRALTSLSMTASDLSFSDTTLDIMVTPSLHSFSYSGSRGDDRLPITDILSLVERSGCEIRNLKVTRPGVVVTELGRFLRGIPTIYNLKISLGYSSDSAALLRCLSQRNLRTDTDPFLPHLERLDLAASAPFPWRSFIKIFDDESATEPSEQNFARVPQRKELQITFRVKSPVVPYRITDFMDLITMYKLTVLWRKHNVFSVFLPYGDEHDRSKSFLEQSYDAHAAAPAGEETVRKLGNRDLRQDIVAMASLQF